MTAPSIPLQHLSAAKKDKRLSLLLRQKDTAVRRAAIAAEAVDEADAAILEYLSEHYPADPTTAGLGVNVE